MRRLAGLAATAATVLLVAGCGGVPSAVKDDALPIANGATVQGEFRAGDTVWHQFEVLPGSVSLKLELGVAGVKGHLGVYNAEGWQVLSEPIEPHRRGFDWGFLVAEKMTLYLRVITNEGQAPYALTVNLAQRSGP